MDNHSIYKQVMLGHYMNKMKYLRNSWDYENSMKLGVQTLIDIGGSDQRRYIYLMERCTEYVYDMLADIVAKLFELYDIPVYYYDLRSTPADLYYIGEQEDHLDYSRLFGKRRIMAFSRRDNYQDVLYIFKEYGIGKRVPEPTLLALMKRARLSKFCYISYVEEDAFSEIINHNDDENDPTRGTGIFSFKQFVIGLFGIHEYMTFRKYADEFSRRVKDFFGFELMRTLKPNTMHNFRKEVRDHLLGFDALSAGLTRNICTTQRQIIENQFITKKNYEILLGGSDFAQSYMTAEWLYHSMENAGNIDLTAVSMGYFKAIEQLLFQYIKLHTHEKDGGSRKIYVGGNKYAKLTDSFVNDSEKVKDVTLGSLTGFFGYHNKRKKEYYNRNEDLLVDGITQDTYRQIIDLFDEVAGLRNGYFHKDNLKEWNKVIATRNKAHIIFFILLGAYKITEKEKQELGCISVEDHDDFYKLCEYINRKAYDDGLRTRPIFYFDDNDGPGDAYVSRQDDFIEYDIYGEPVFSGAFFSVLGQRIIVKRITKDALPKEIWEGTITIGRDTTISISGPQKIVFREGLFVAEEENACTDRC